MVENNPSDVKLDENPDGTVSFATDVVATIAGLAATEVEGVASMSSPSSALADMFSRKNTRNFTKGVRIDLDGNCVTVDVTIVVEYGSPVPDVARSIQENVKKAIETMSGLTVHSVDVHVSGISFERDQRAAKELDEQQKKMLERAKAETEAPAAEPEKVQEQPEKEPADDDIDIEEDIDEIEPEDEPEEEPDADSEEE
ncbi:MAG: Asp23/Gls24 family envelope stress response protein [Candidatus Faecivicinus sp.]|nr:Asp23/Gls24 family envelope stress response protein [Candidatus Faecivicinus sp.]